MQTTIALFKHLDGGSCLPVAMFGCCAALGFHVLDLVEVGEGFVGELCQQVHHLDPGENVRRLG
jgi:hypothetical protein